MRQDGKAGESGLGQKIGCVVNARQVCLKSECPVFCWRCQDKPELLFGYRRNRHRIVHGAKLNGESRRCRGVPEYFDLIIR